MSPRIWGPRQISLAEHAGLIIELHVLGGQQARQLRELGGLNAAAVDLLGAAGYE
jgi:hypothetical protein